MKIVGVAMAAAAAMMVIVLSSCNCKKDWEHPNPKKVEDKK